jgi:hypothetical protein
LQHGKLRDEVERFVEVACRLLVVAGVALGDGELANRIGEEDAVLRSGLVELVGGLITLSGLVALLQDRRACGLGLGQRGGEQGRARKQQAGDAEAVFRGNSQYTHRSTAPSRSRQQPRRLEL